MSIKTLAMGSGEIREHGKQIEANNESNCVDFVATKTTSWPIVLGSLDDAIVCESSLSPVDSDNTSASRKPGLVLRRPFHDSGPCEIKISFEQKHEIRQVYVRSTARVYEIYFAADAQSMNDYLCTVRCGMAAKNEEFVPKVEYLQKIDTVTSTSSSSCSSKLLQDGELKTDSGSSTNEDGWVEIKDPDSSMTEDGNGSHSNETDAQREKEKLDFYEATAEISDANPCTSMTIRLLSIQSSESVYLEEVYIFADPVECDDVNSTSNTVESSTQNSLMSMLVPTLLQLSKSRMSQIHEQHDRNSKERNAHQDFFQNMSTTYSSAKLQQEEIPCISDEREVVTDKLNCASDQLTRLEVPDQPSNRTTSGTNPSSYGIGKKLDELVSRIARIEEFCSRFEERIINPITSMDARLEKVEQQLELLNEKFLLSLTHSSSRIRAPEFSCGASESSSFYNDGNTTSSCKASESLKKDDNLSNEVPAPLSNTPPSAVNAYLVPDDVAPVPEFSCSSGPPEHDECLSDDVANTDMPSPVSAHLVPSLVVTAPDFSYGDDDEENDVSKSVADSPKVNLKKPLSIDDAMAFALGGFLSSTSTEHLTNDAAPITSKTDFASKKARANILTPELVECDELVVAHHLNATSEISSGAVAENREREIPPFGSDSEQTVENFAGDDHVSGEESVDNCLVHDVKDQICEAEKTSADDAIVISEEVEVGNVDENASMSSSEVATKVGSSSGAEVAREASDVLHSILNLPINSAVDYKTSILDVKFAAQESSNIKTSSLEALLTETMATNVESLSIVERDGGEISGQDYLIEPGYDKVTSSESIEHLLVESGLDDLE